jgi:penicillin-binding protein 2
MAALANDGTRYRPHLVKSIVSPDGTVVKDVQPEVMSKVDVKPETFAAI